MFSVSHKKKLEGKRARERVQNVETRRMNITLEHREHFVVKHVKYQQSQKEEKIDIDNLKIKRRQQQTTNTSSKATSKFLSFFYIFL
jgi:hypothetical protein